MSVLSAALACPACGNEGAPRDRAPSDASADAPAPSTDADAADASVDSPSAAVDARSAPDAPSTDSSTFDARRDVARDAPVVDSGLPEDGGAPEAGPVLDAPVDALPPYDGPRFVNATVSAGLQYRQGPSTQSEDCTLTALTGCGVQMSGGAAAGDYDGDGHIDLYVTRIDAADILFRNRGDGTFENATLAAGLTFNLPSNGAGWGDIDNDGDLDLYVTTLGDVRFYLFINDGSGAFTEEAVVRGAAVANLNNHQGFSVSFGDFDRDGWIDIHTTEWRPRELVAVGAPSNNRLLRNRGAAAPGHFEDVTEAAGVSLEGIDSKGEWGFASSFTDLDDDGWPDLAVASDFGTSRLFWNNQDGTFVDGTSAAGVGLEQNGMGSAIGDYDGDGLLDWFVTAIFCDDALCDGGATGNRLYRNNGDRTFADHTDLAGVRNGRWGWGAAFFDYDNDGDLDLAMTNGMDLAETTPESDFFRTDRSRFWRNDGGTFVELGRSVGIDERGNGKGLLVFDYDGDGDMDLFIARRGETPVLYRNDGRGAGDYLRVKLVGTTSNRGALGARVTVTPASGTSPLLREVRAGNHFLGQSETALHFGLGAGTDPVAEVRIRWPSGGPDQVLTAVGRNQEITVVEP